MNIRFLETFIWVAKLRSFSLAAERLNTTQTSVSHRIGKLEQELGTRLFKRSKRDVALTRDGRDALANAQAIVSNFYDMKLSFNKGLFKKQLFIGASEAAVLTFMPGLFDILSDRFESISLEVDTSNVINKMLRDREVEFAVSLLDFTDDQIVSIPLCDLQINWVASSKLGLKNAPMSLKDISAYPIIRWPSGTYFNQLDTEAVGRGGHGNFHIKTSAGIATIIRMVTEIGAVCLMTPVLAQKELEEGSLQIINVKGELPPARMYLSYLRETPRPLSQTVRSSCEEALSDFADRSNGNFIRLLMAGADTGLAGKRRVRPRPQATPDPVDYEPNGGR